MVEVKNVSKQYAKKKSLMMSQSSLKKEKLLPLSDQMELGKVRYYRCVSRLISKRFR